MKVTKRDITVFALGLLAMFFLDMIFQFNDSMTKFERGAKKEKKKIEKLFNRN